MVTFSLLISIGKCILGLYMLNIYFWNFSRVYLPKRPIHYILCEIWHLKGFWIVK